MSIKAGDLVMTVRVTHSCYSKFIGIPFKVAEIYSADKRVCDFCGHEFGFVDAALGERNAKGQFWIGGKIEWLKKIDPPSTGELDRVPVRMKEPA